jgi:acyl-CoA synthetase (AMP-forming)/AMP-acid ligase II
VFVASASHAGMAADLVDAAPAVHTWLAVGGATEGFEDYASAVAAYPSTPIPDETEGADMLYTSGTTGRPKGVRQPLRPDVPMGGAHPQAIALAALYGVGADAVYLSPAPLYHAAPLVFSLGVQRHGGTVVVMERFDPADALALIERHHVTHGQWVPTMLIRLLRLPEEERRRFDLSSLRVAVHAAAPCPVAVKEELIEWWGPIVYEYYGGTERNGLTFITSEDWLTHKGSVGRPVGCKVHILDAGGDELPAGEPGTVYFEGALTFEYHNDPSKTAAARTSDGWSTLGDVGYLDEEGFLYLTDRHANTIISGGVNVYPQEAENVLATHPAVADAAVVGIPDDEFGEEVKAVVQPVDWGAVGPALEQELIAFCRSQLAAFKCPRSVDFDEALPRDPNGKLYKRRVRDRYWSAGR